MFIQSKKGRKNMEQDNKFFSKINRSISDFLYEEEGNISRGKILTVGSLVLLAGIIFADEVFAAHRSHSSHRSPSSHSSGSYGGHYSHQSHQSHSSSSGGGYTHNSSGGGGTQAPANTPSPVETLPTFNTPQTPVNTPIP